MKYEEHIEKTADIFYEAIKNGTAPWLKEWKADDFKYQAHNPVTGTIYQGMNAFMLDLIRIEKNYKDNSWLTFKQIKDLGGFVEKGSKSTDIVYFERKVRTQEDIEKKEKKILSDKTLDDKTKQLLVDSNKEKKIDLIFKSSNVFNIAQTKDINMDKFKALYKDNNFEKKDFISIEECQKILNNINDVKIKHLYQTRAYYDSSNDEIVLPLKEQFTSAEAYYSTAFHELGHSTGHESRLNRDLANSFGTPAYAKEELRAEIYSFLQAKELGMDYNLGNHQSYIDSWTKDLEDKKTEIYEAVKDSFKIVDFVKERYIDKALEKNITHEFSINYDIPNWKDNIFNKSIDDYKFLQDLSNKELKNKDISDLEYKKALDISKNDLFKRGFDSEFITIDDLKNNKCSLKELENSYKTQDISLNYNFAKNEDFSILKAYQTQLENHYPKFITLQSAFFESNLKSNYLMANSDLSEIKYLNIDDNGIQTWKKLNQNEAKEFLEKYHFPQKIEEWELNKISEIKKDLNENLAQDISDKKPFKLKERKILEIER